MGKQDDFSVRIKKEHVVLWKRLLACLLIGVSVAEQVDTVIFSTTLRKKKT